MSVLHYMMITTYIEIQTVTGLKLMQSQAACSSFSIKTCIFQLFHLNLTLSSKFSTLPSHLSLGKRLLASLWLMVDAQLTGCQSDSRVTTVLAQTTFPP